MNKLILLILAVLLFATSQAKFRTQTRCCRKIEIDESDWIDEACDACSKGNSQTKLKIHDEEINCADIEEICA